MNGEPVSGCYYDPGSRKKIILHVVMKPNGLDGYRPWYIKNYGPYVGMSAGWNPPRDWYKWELYTGQPDCLEEAKVNSLVALARSRAPYEPKRPWWRFW